MAYPSQLFYSGPQYALGTYNYLRIGSRDIHPEGGAYRGYNEYGNWLKILPYGDDFKAYDESKESLTLIPQFNDRSAEETRGYALSMLQKQFDKLMELYAKVTPPTNDERLKIMTDQEWISRYKAEYNQMLLDCKVELFAESEAWSEEGGWKPAQQQEDYSPQELKALTQRVKKSEKSTKPSAPSTVSIPPTPQKTKRQLRREARDEARAARKAERKVEKERERAVRGEEKKRRRKEDSNPRPDSGSTPFGSSLRDKLAGLSGLMEDE